MSHTSPNQLPNEIVQAIAVANAKSIGEQPAILANCALANQIFNANLQQQAALAQQQAMFQVLLATVSKVVSVILTDGVEGDEKKANVLKSLEFIDELKQKFDAIQESFQKASQANVEMAAKFAEQLKQSQPKSNDT